MEKKNNKTYRWIERLIDKITKDNFPNNISFNYYGHDIHCTSGTISFTSVYCQDLFDFSFDYWTKRLIITMYSNEYICNTIVKTFKHIYGEKNINLIFESDEAKDEIKRIEKEELNNDEYDQELVKEELIYLYAYHNFCKDEIDKKTYVKCEQDYKQRFDNL